jgi:caffeoyl-CoA O-methyltransferase
MELVNHIAETYAAAHTSALDALLQQIEKETNQHHPHAHMLSGSVQGQLLQMISCMVKPKYVLEIGTFTGFSALCLAKGLQIGGQLHTIELRQEDADTAQKYFSQISVNYHINQHVGDAKHIIPTLNFNWDLVFLDADKTGYIEYYELILPQLNVGGYIIADNVLFHGEVLNDEVKGKNAKAIDAFNQHVLHDKRTQQVLLTVRDGLLLIKKVTK